MKQTAALSSLFIFVNSLAGLAGIFFTGFNYKDEIWFMIAIAFAGGLAGSYLGATKFNTAILKYILALVLVIASVNLFFP